METIAWVELEGGPVVRLLDQTQLPSTIVAVDCGELGQLEEAIVQLRVRGAPAIGCAAAYGLALVAARSRSASAANLLSELHEAQRRLAATRPTAVNLFWALDRMMAVAERQASGVRSQESGGNGTTTPTFGDRAGRDEIVAALVAEARAIAADDLDRCRRIGAAGVELIPTQADILTHCNAGALATAGYGTALGVVRAAHEAGKRLHVWVDETRPLLQGARLTAWELQQEGIPYTVICDNTAAFVMAQGRVDCVVVGADRIARNGDVANKIGTYGVALLAHHHAVPFYVAAPMSTVDFTVECGADIPIEERAAEEVTHLAHYSPRSVCPDGARVYSPAFDVTPADLMAAIITDRGVIRPPFAPHLLQARDESVEV